MTQPGLMRLLKIIILLAVVLNATGLFMVPVKAQTSIPPSPSPIATATPTPTPTPVGPSPVRLRLIAQANPDPLPAGDEADITLTLALNQQPNGECIGIPGYPLDAFFVIDNSASAGTGRGSNIALTQQWLLDWIAQAEPVIFTSSGGTPQHIRLGIVASRVTARGTELLWQTLTEDYAQLRVTVESLASGGDTSLAPGIKQATTALQQRARPNARQVLVLILHDRLPLTEETLAALQAARQAGIETYLFVNSLNLDPAQVVDATTASFVDADHFWVDPTEPQRQRALVQMTGGTTQYLAQEIQVTVTWLPEGLTAVAGVGTKDNTVQWAVAHLAEQENAELKYRVKVAPALATQGFVNAVAQIAYQDCNGVQRTESAELSLWVAAARATATSTALPPTQTSRPSTEMPVVPTATETPAAPATTKPQNPTATPNSFTLPTIGPPSPEQSVSPSRPSQGPIDQFIAWLINLIPSAFASLTPLIGALPTVLQWLLIIILIILLLLLLWWLLRKLIQWWRNRKPRVKEGLPSEPVGPIPPSPSEPSVPEWLKKLKDNPLPPERGGRNGQ